LHGEHSCRKFREHSGNIQWQVRTYASVPHRQQRAGQGLQGMYVGNIQGTFREHSKNIKGPFKEHSNINTA
jgi:hypothetical protein